MTEHEPPSTLRAPSGGPPRVLIVGGGPFQLGVITAAAELGAETIVLDRHEDAPGMRLASVPLAVDTADVNRVVDVAFRYQVDGVLTAASDAALAAVAEVVAARGLCGLGPDVVRRCRNKLLTYQTIAKAGLPCPRTVPVEAADDLKRTVADLGGYPVVTKPPSNAGGRGVSIVSDAASAMDAFLRARRYSKEDEPVLLQQYVGGLSLGVEAFFWRGTVAAAFVMDDQYQDGFVSPVGHSVPCSIADEIREQVIEDVARFGRCLGLSDGPVNFDLRRVEGQTVLLEVNARLGGNSITDLLRVGLGVDLSRAAVKTALGDDPRPDLHARQSVAAAARLILVRGGPKLWRRPVPAASARAKVVSLDYFFEDGEPSPLVADQWSIAGRCIVTAEDGNQAVAEARELGSALSEQVVLEPPR